jgi:sterol desaturase/sphingolipid hydroxylase (fatty acid hydroxylase superfamily)
MSNINVASLQRASRTPTTAIVHYGYLAFMLVGVNGVAIAMAGSGAPKWQLFGPLLVAVAVSFGAERIAPYQPEWNRSRGDAGRDAAHAAVNEVLQIGSLFLLPVFVAAVAIDGVWPTHSPFWLQVLGSVVVVDAGITVAHWWSHRSTPLWRLHSVHHSVERFYGFNGLMKHPLHQIVETMVATAPLAVLGLPVDVATAVVVLVAIQLLVQHSNVDYCTAGLHRVLALNVVHRFHHLRWPGVGDVNFGLFLTAWDRLLGTYVEEPGKEFDSSALGIAAEPDYPTHYLAQLAHPFRPYEPQPAEVPGEWMR